MPVLGSGGRVLLKRPNPQACTLSVTRTSVLSATHLSSDCPGWWNGDLVCFDKLPIVIDGYPILVPGYASYQESKWFVGPNRDHIINDSDKFYKDEPNECYPDPQCQDDAQFYVKQGVGDIPSDEEAGGNFCYYVHIDQFGFITLYDSKCAAISGCGKPIELGNVWFEDEINVYPLERRRLPERSLGL